MSGLCLLDCNAVIGIGPSWRGGQFPGVEDLVVSMDRFCISSAIAVHAVARYSHPFEGNRKLAALVHGQKRILSSWVVLPDTVGEFPPAKELPAMLKQNQVVSVRVCPTTFSIPLYPWVWDPLCSVLAAMRMPLFLDFDLEHWSDKLPWDDIRTLCRRYPSLPVILVGIGGAYNRLLWPLLDQCSNLSFEISCFDACGGLEAVSKRFGAGRMLFGTGAPLRNPACPISMLWYADLSEDERASIACGNMERLVGGILYA